MNNLFKIGDIVKLKSGGPNMTINTVNENLEENKYVFNGTYECLWFDNFTIKKETFYEQTISKVEHNT